MHTIDHAKKISNYPHTNLLALLGMLTRSHTRQEDDHRYTAYVLIMKKDITNMYALMCLFVFLNI